ncbi:hypothetical protein [Luteimonas saliphila]|uniref:hypothetical protein n=1 Tax=Luteimonas saliphila TaxID=2804919 RepID=UPI00192D82F9|nr:hypothetical protein [Luteimonas saliphila]
MAADHQKKVAKLRDQIAELKQRLSDNATPPRPLGEAIRLAEEYVDSRAEDFRLDTTDLMYSGGLFRLPIHDARDLLEFMAWMDPEAMKKRFRDTLEAQYAEREGPVDTVDLRKQVEEWKRALFNLEVEEERTVLASEEAGSPVRRRNDADPEAVIAA